MSAIRHQPALYRIVVSHYLVAAIFFLALTIMFMFSINEIAGHYFQPKILALTHTAALGWGTLIIFGALYQLLPVILETPLYSIRLCWGSFLLLVPGIMLLICAFWFFDPGLMMQVAGILVLSGILLFNLNVLLTLKNKQQTTIFQEFIVTSCMWLALTAVLGLLLVFNFRFSFLPQDHLAFLRLHAHMGIAGWFLMLIIGVSAKLIPMFLVSKYQQTALLSAAYYLINAALLLFLIDGYFFGINFRTNLILLIGVAGLCTYLVYVYRCFVSRIRKDVDLAMVQTLFSFVLLAASIGVLPFLFHYHLKQNPLATNLSVLYGILIFIGWISALIIGQTFKTLPFIVWVKHYEHLTGKVKTPMPADLNSNLLLAIQCMAFLLFLITFISGFVFSSGMMKYIGASCLVITALCYCLHIAHLLLHQTKTQHYDRI
ncbi:hypothetical protein [Pedobacter immunditicola]|uniref:hypothetical protein n=1 Tax=Pedobacter immunditicola TaxID=3133440 RepID=UPI0030AB5018